MCLEMVAVQEIPAQEIRDDTDTMTRALLHIPYSRIVATKLEAFHGRGSSDVTASHDLEDILTVVDDRPELVSEIGAAEPEVRAFIAGEVRTRTPRLTGRHARAGDSLWPAVAKRWWPSPTPGSPLCWRRNGQGTAPPRGSDGAE